MGKQLDVLPTPPKGYMPTLGTDFELFLTDAEGTIVPADNLLPREVDSIKGQASARTLGQTELFYDGVQAEMKIPAHTCRGYVLDNLVYAFRLLRNTINEKGLSPLLEPTVDIDDRVMQATLDPMSRMFGCAPHQSFDLNGQPEIIYVDAETHMLRYAGGHIHLGAAKYAGLENTLLTAEGRLRTVRMLDIILGIPFVLLERMPDRIRRQLYGRAGTYREKPYGLEYRTPSNLWGRHPALANLALSLARDAVRIVSSDMDQYFELDREAVAHAINNVDKDLASELWSQIKDNLYRAQSDPYRQDMAGKGMAAFDFTAMQGIDNIIPAESFYDNWKSAEHSVPYHGNLTPSWIDWSANKFSCRAMAKDWEKFSTTWSPKQTYEVARI